ncbi:hypothetical protein ACQP1W_12200 [Spirillospora sp. CA-255316]
MAVSGERSPHEREKSAPGRKAAIARVAEGCVRPGAVLLLDEGPPEEVLAEFRRRPEASVAVAALA